MSAQTPAPCQRRARLGWISAPAELVDPLVARKSAADSGSPTLDQLTLVGSWHPVRTSGTSPLPAAPTGAAATSSCARWQRSSPGCRSSAPLRGCNCSLCSPRTPMTSPSPRQPPPRASTSPYCRRCTLGQARNRACWSASADSLNTESLPQSTRYGPCSATLAQHSRPEHISARSAPPPPTPPGPSGLCKAARAREECGGLTTECDVGQVASRRSGGLDSRAQVVPTLPLRSCGYSEEQRSADTATARRPLSPNAAEQGTFLAGACFPGADRAQGPEGLSVAAGHRPGLRAAHDCQSVRVYAFDQCPRQDSNLRSRLRRGLPCRPWPAETSCRTP
jgi:hypothetical protein